VWESFLSISPHLLGGTMSTSQTCCHLPGEILNSAAECADRARIAVWDNIQKVRYYCSWVVGCREKVQSCPRYYKLLQLQDLGRIPAIRPACMAKIKKNWIDKSPVLLRASLICMKNTHAIIRGVVDSWASSDAACHAGGLGSIPGPGQTYVWCGKVALFCNPASGGTFSSTAIEIIK
jgi:hypothetical protein